MAGPSTVEERDYLEAVRMQLREDGAGEVWRDTLLHISLHSEPDPATLYDISTACGMTAAELAVAHDAELAHMLARQVTAHVTAGPSSIKCSICLEMTPTFDRFLSSKCGHSFCKPCMRQHLVIIATETRQYPLTCPQCQATAAKQPVELDPQHCLAIMAGTGAAYVALERLILEKKHMERIRYCANPACSMPFDWADNPAVRGRIGEFRVMCPSCNKETCVNCKVQWHVDRTCEQYVVEKEGTDAFAKLAREEAWKACPKCDITIDRQKGDCNFVKCKCGCGFCYNCGKEYFSLEETPNNAHGSPNCTCGLFRNDEEPAAANGEQADEVVAPNVAPHEPEPVQVQRVSVPTRLGTLVRSLWKSFQLPKRSGNWTLSPFLEALKLNQER